MKRRYDLESDNCEYWYDEDSKRWAPSEMIDGPRSSVEHLKNHGRKRAISAAKRLANLCGKSILREWVRIKGVRYVREFTFEIPNKEGE